MPDYLTRRLQPQEFAALERHLAGCASCRREWELEQVLAGALKMPSPVLPPPDFAARLLAQTQEEKSRESKQRLWSFLPKLSYGTAGAFGFVLLAWIATLAGLFLTGGVATGWFRQVTANLAGKIAEGTGVYTGYWESVEIPWDRLLGVMNNFNVLLPFLFIVFILQAIPSFYFSFQAFSSSDDFSS